MMLMKTNENLEISKSDFPVGFAWGVATSAYQIEGAYDQGGRGLSIWDTFCEVPGVIADGTNGNVACDHVNRLEEDLDLIKSLGFSAYRFSISWPRVQPKGYGDWNEEGFEFYERLLCGLKKREIEPHVTLNHWDLPQCLQDLGGWRERSTVDNFVRYALEVGRRFGSRCSSICTHNEPWVIAILGHEHGIFAPGIKSRSIAMQVSHNLLLSHGLACKAIRDLGVSVPLGIVLNLSPIYPASDSAEDVAKAHLDDGLNARWYLDAITGRGYPSDVLTYLGADAPTFTEQEMQLIAQPLDYLGVNYYTRNFSSTGNPWDVRSSGNEVTDMGWEVYPQGLTELLLRLHQDYNFRELWVTENGAAFKDEIQDGQIGDSQREDYFRRHVMATREAIDLGAPVKAYFAWSLMDNFEWASGYSKRFGLVHIDYQTLKRTPKQSAYWFQNFLKA